MFYNYLIVALRNLRNQPGLTAIKVLSLSLGMVCSILVLMHVQYANSYDKHFENWQNIYRVVASFTTDQRIDGNLIPEGMFPPLLNDYAQIEKGAKISPNNGLFARGDISSANDFTWVDPELLDIFSFQFIQGDRATALTEPNTVVLSQRAAFKYFGAQDPLGQVLTLDNGRDLRVTGVIRDLPSNTHADMNMEIMIGSDTGRQIFGETFMNGPAWMGFNNTRAYVVIPDPRSVDSIRSDFAAFITRNAPEAQLRFAQQYDLAFDLEPLSDIYLSPRTGFSAADNTKVIVLTGLVVFAALILLSSVINFANLSLSQMQQRGKELGVRKTLGATRMSLLSQFMVESLLLTLVALIVALPVIYLAVGPYTALTSTQFSFGSMFGSSQVLIIIMFVLLTGILSGLVPALKMSKFSPTASLSGKRDGGRSSRLLRAGLTLVQFSFAVILVLLAMAITAQVRHLNEVDIGFNRSHLLILETRYDPRNPEQFNYDALVNDLRQHPGIVTVARTDSPPPSNGGYNPWRHISWAEDDIRTVSHLGVDEHYIEAMQLQLLAGRNFSREFISDYMPTGRPDPEQTYGVMITPAAVRNFGFSSNEEAVDQVLTAFGIRFRIIGVVNEFRLSGGMEDVLRSTSILRTGLAPMPTLLIRIDPAQRESALQHIDSVWVTHRPDVPINREFYEQTFNQLIYEETNGINRAAQFAAIITIVIAALGLYALAFYSTQRRTKEIGVRKVLGASVSSITSLLSVDFVKPVIVACVVASAVGYIVTNFYFSQFSAQASLSPLVYLLIIVGTVLLALATVASQCVRAASADPVKSLRSE